MRRPAPRHELPARLLPQQVRLAAARAGAPLDGVPPVLGDLPVPHALHSGSTRRAGTSATEIGVLQENQRRQQASRKGVSSRPVAFLSES